MKRVDSYPARPFVKWVGGKTQLLEDIKKSLPLDLSQRENMTYVEPFVGGGAVLFWILQEYPNITRAVINDINAELICAYRVVRSDVENLIMELDRLQSEYLLCDKDARNDYYLAKRERFNSSGKSSLETASLFIFLNRTCFNGLYRVNSKGKFNVLHGRYSNPKNVDNDDDFFERLYKVFNIKRVSASRMINSNGDGRGAISEIMISNVVNVY